MEKWICNKCRYENDGIFKVCQQCGVSIEYDVNNQVNEEVAQLPHKKQEDEIKEETILKLIASICLWVGIFSSFVLFIAALGYISDNKEEIGYSLLFLIPYIIPATIIAWGLLKVVSNISISLKEINSKIKND